MNKFFDLSFVIGLFFLIIGSLLLIFSLTTTPEEGFNKSVNLWCSISFIVFAVIMLILSRDKKPGDKQQF